MDGPTLISLLSALISAGAVVIAWRKLKPENRRINGEAAVTYMQASQLAAQQMVEMQKRLDALEDEIASLKKALLTAEEKAAKFESWARRLSHQVISLGSQPVSLEFAEGKRKTGT